MGKLTMDKGFWKAVDVIQEMPLEQRKNEFLMITENYKAGKYSIDTVLIMAVALGKHDGELWFREMIPLPDRLTESEKINQGNFPLKTKKSLNKALLGAVTY